MTTTTKQFREVRTGDVFNLGWHPEKHGFILENEKKQIKNFYLNFLPIDDVEIKLNTGERIMIPSQSFLEYKADEKVTHRKIIGVHKKLVKI